MRRWFTLLRPWHRATDPVYLGMDRIPDDRPLLFVGNHTLFGMLDAVLMYFELYFERGIILRGLGDRAHFTIPMWGRQLRRFGIVEGSPEVCGALMEGGECVLVFPGGAREVTKRKGEKYQLVWKDRVGFARMAIKHRCTIVPFSAVGVEDMFDIVYDASDILKSPIGRALKKFGLREDMMLPVTRAAGGGLFPDIERFYFQFGDPIDTARFDGNWEDRSLCEELRDEVKGAIEAGIDDLIAHRATDEFRHGEKRPE